MPCWQQVACLTYFRGYLFGPTRRRCHFLAVCSKAWLLHTHTHRQVNIRLCVCTSIKLSDHRGRKKKGNCRAAETTLLQLRHLQLVRLFCRNKAGQSSEWRKSAGRGGGDCIGYIHGDEVGQKDAPLGSKLQRTGQRITYVRRCI